MMNPDILLPGERLVATVRRRLHRWHRSECRSYPWRDVRDPWQTLAAEFMLQRTRASQVEPVFLEFIERFPTATSLVDAGPTAARGLTDRLGLHWRGDLLFRAAQIVADEGGAPPEDLAELRRISGIGPYTAAAWLSLHRNKRAVIVDANVSRWLSRMTGMPYERDPRHVRWVNDLADRLTPPRAFRRYNYAILDFTMEICTPRSPHCGECPVRNYCNYNNYNRESKTPTTR